MRPAWRPRCTRCGGPMGKGRRSEGVCRGCVLADANARRERMATLAAEGATSRRSLRSSASHTRRCASSYGCQGVYTTVLLVTLDHIWKWRLKVATSAHIFESAAGEFCVRG